MLQQFKIAYAFHLWVRALAWLGLVSLAILLLAVSGGFPPQSWILLAQSLPVIGRLLAAHGLPALASFTGVFVLSLTWGLAWAALLWLSITLLRHGKQGRRAPAKTNWQRNSADNLLKQGFDEPQASLAYAALARTATPAPRPPPLPSPPRREASRSPKTQQIAPVAPKAPTPLSRPAVTTAATTAVTTEEYERVDVTVRRVVQSACADAGIGWDPGITRKHKPNEDSVLAVRSICDARGRLLPIALYVVADGMGGHASGRVASHLATHSMMQSVLPAVQHGEELSDTFLMDTLTDCAHLANQVIHEYKEEHGVDLGTTITAALLVESTAYIVNVGDSRTYIYRRDGGLAQITHDHSLVARLVSVGAISAEDAYTHPDRNKIYRGLGEKDSVQVDWFIEPVQERDYLLLCSDGLWEMVRDHEIEKILKRCLPDVSQASDALIKAALHRGGSDNVSVIVAPV
ncbi:MAG TPA: protein phosphatase 2C domain-containing protein [Ktedonobacteraceae bacterium]|nr:protein phosphatase 2C domain-containing protein [Ktedonobacteraceae bacterium]